MILLTTVCISETTVQVELPHSGMVIDLRPNGWQHGFDWDRNLWCLDRTLSPLSLRSMIRNGRITVNSTKSPPLQPPSDWNSDAIKDIHTFTTWNESNDGLKVKPHHGIDQFFFLFRRGRYTAPSILTDNIFYPIFLIRDPRKNPTFSDEGGQNEKK